jgi:hypothetical protein
MIPRGAGRAAPVALILVAAAGLGAQAADPSEILLVDPATTHAFPLGTGDPLLHVALFATWCQDCIDELDTLSDLEDRWSERGYRLVLVAVRSRQSPERLAAFAEGRTLPGRLALDGTGRLEKALGATRLPTHVLLDAKGAEVGRADSAEGIVPLVERALSGAGRRR